MNVEDLSGWLLKTLEDKGWTQSELARKSGVNQVTISRILNGDRGMGIDVAVKLADTFGIEREEILKRMGVLRPSPPTDTPTIAQMLAEFAQLSGEEQEQILKQVRALNALRKSTAG